jgi:hypothetical protein
MVQLQRDRALGARTARTEDKGRRKHGTTGLNQAPSAQFHEVLPVDPFQNAGGERPPAAQVRADTDDRPEQRLSDGADLPLIA